MVGFIRKKVSSYTLGEKLKKMREELCISKAEISKATKIRNVYLEKIEQGKFDELPADVYVRGFLKSYAGYIGLDPAEVVRQYERERGVQDSMKKKDKGQQPNWLKRFRMPMITVTPKMITAVVFGLVIVAGIFYFYREIGKFSQAPRLIIMQPSSDVSIKGSLIDVVGMTDKENKVTINDQPIYVDEEGQFKEALSLQKGLNSITVSSINRFGKEIKKSFNVSADYETDHLAQSEEKVAGAETDNQSHEVQVETDKIALEIRAEEMPTWISVEADGKNVQSGTMLAGSTQSFEAQDQISVTSGKANKTFVKLNGQDLGKLSDDPGVVRNVIFNKDTKIIPKPVQEEKPAEKEN
jgi:cytoskeletal protein RodZ